MEEVKQGISEVEQDIRKVEKQIADVEGQLANPAPDTDVAYLKNKEDRLREKENRLRKEKEQLRDAKMMLLKADTSGLEGGMKIGSEIGNPVASDHLLSQFVACLRDSTLQERINNAKSNSVIELPKGIVWLGDDEIFSNQLFMRPCYFDLLEAKEEYFKLNSRLRAVVYTGTPGIGKSHMCAFVVARKLIAGTVVFFERAVKSDKDVEERAVYRLQLESDVQCFKSSLFLNFVSPKENVVYIEDSIFAGFLTTRVEIQIFASPSKALYRPDKKVWGSYLYLHTPLFDLEELQSMRSTVSAFQKVSTEDVDEWFMAAGGVARTVLKRASLRTFVKEWKTDVQSLIFTMEKEDIEKVVIGIHDGVFLRGSDTLFHWRVDEKYVGKKGDSPEKLSLRRFKTRVLCLASAWVANKLHLKFRFEKLVSIASLIMTMNKDVELAALRGYRFETLAHMKLSGRGKFNCRWLDTNEKFTLTLPQSEYYFFKSDEDASVSCRDDFSTYCVPMGRNQAAIDSLSSPFLFFQMASGPEHSINKDGMVCIMNAMNKGGHCTLKAESKVRGRVIPVDRHVVFRYSFFALHRAILILIITLPRNLCKARGRLQK